MKTIGLLVFVTTAWGQPSLAPPCFGKIVDQAGFLRELCGVSGSFVLSEASPQKAVSAGFSRTGAWIKTGTSLRITDGAVRYETSVPEGEALFTFNANGSPRFAYFTATKEMFEWNGSALQQVEVPAWAASGVAMLLPDQRLLTYSDGALRIGDKAFPLDNAPAVMEWINPDWIHLRGAALRITPGREALFVLPEAN